RHYGMAGARDLVGAEELGVLTEMQVQAGARLGAKPVARGGSGADGPRDVVRLDDEQRRAELHIRLQQRELVRSGPAELEVERQRPAFGIEKPRRLAALDSGRGLGSPEAELRSERRDAEPEADPRPTVGQPIQDRIGL